MKLYTFWRSSCSWRVRIALAYKGLDVDVIPIHLQREGGEQFSSTHQARNPMAQVPVLQIEPEWSLSQSIAIMEYLEESYPQPPLLPSDLKQRAILRQIAEMINSGIQPLQNSSTLKKLDGLGVDKAQWAQFWIQQGLDRVEQLTSTLPKTTFFLTEHPTIAECCLIPQLYNARRFGCDLSQWDNLLRVESQCLERSEFQISHPDQQIDAE